MIAVLVFGSRTLHERGPVWRVLDGIAAWRAEEAEPIVVIEGACPEGGADAFAAQWAEGAPWSNIHHESYPPELHRRDTRRFFERNVTMRDRLLELRAQGAHLQAWGFVDRPLERSRGSKMMAGLLEGAGVPYQIVQVVRPPAGERRQQDEPQWPGNRAPFIGRVRRR